LLFLKFSGLGVAPANATAALRPVGLRSPRRCCAARPHRRLPIRSAGRHHRIAAVLLRYLHYALLTYASCRSRLPYCGILCCRRRNYAAPPCAADLPSRPRCSLRSSRRYDDDLRERRLCYTAPSRYVSPLRFSTTACRPCRRCVTRHPTRYRFIATPAHRAAAAARSFSTPLRYRSRLGL